MLHFKKKKLRLFHTSEKSVCIWNWSPSPKIPFKIHFMTPMLLLVQSLMSVERLKLLRQVGGVVTPQWHNLPDFPSSRKEYTCSNKGVIYNIVGFHSSMICHNERQAGIHASISNKVSLFYTVGLDEFSLAICNLLKDLKSPSRLRYKR